jgi:hypothetical protein
MQAELDKHKETFIPNKPRDLMDVYLEMLRSNEKTSSFSGKDASTPSLLYSFLNILKKLVV